MLFVGRLKEPACKSDKAKSHREGKKEPKTTFGNSSLKRMDSIQGTLLLTVAPLAVKQ